MKPIRSTLLPTTHSFPSKRTPFSKSPNYYYSSRAFLLLFLGYTSSFVLTDCNHAPRGVEDATIGGPSCPAHSPPIVDDSSSSSTHTVLSRGTRRSWDQARSYSTSADAYYQSWGTIPPPHQRHVSLLDLLQTDTRLQGQATLSLNNSTNKTHGVLIIGDVHGCLS
jgi:hypothetical protein